MNINLNTYDLSSFNVREITYGGEAAFHIGGKSNSEWHNFNLFFNDSVFSKDGKLLSGGLPPSLPWKDSESIPMPRKLNYLQFVQDVPGETIIIDFFNRRFSSRIGSNEFNITGFPDEALKTIRGQTNYSFIFKKEGDKFDKLYLVGMVDKKNNYLLSNQRTITDYSVHMGIKRPQLFTFESLPAFLSANNRKNIMVFGDKLCYPRYPKETFVHEQVIFQVK